MKQQDRTNKILWLRISYWTGAIVDLIVGVVLVFLPGVGQHIWGLDKPIQGAGLIFTGYAGSMIIAWTFLLLWADRRPLERRGVAALTCFPVIFGLIGTEVYAIVQNNAPTLYMGLWAGMQTVLLILFAFSYINSRETE